jgi:hypothetical protein
MKPVGASTRGTTNPNRLRRVDNWIARTCSAVLSGAADPLVIDLGYGATPVTAIELRARLARVRPDVRVVGLEIDPVRVANAQVAADPPWLTFARGGFELAGLRPVLVRALNVLRQYDESAVASAWARLTGALAPGGVIIEGTCDEVGRIATWVRLEKAGPVSLTLAARLSTLERPATFAERLPKALIHHNVDGQPIHAFLTGLDTAWTNAAPLGVFGPRQRWNAAVATVAESWPILYRPSSWRHGELTVAWDSVRPHGPES